MELYIDSLEFITEDLTGVSSQELEEGITISLNPFKNFLEINSEDYLIEKIFLHDIYGRVIFASPQTDRLDLGFLDQGVYYLYLKLKDGRTRVKQIQKI